MENTSVNPTKGLKRAYILALGLMALLILLGQWLINSQLQEQVMDARVINLAGRQRMLSQQIPKISLILTQSTYSEKDKSNFRNELKDILSTWEKTHLGLQFGDKEAGLSGKNSQKILSLFKQIEPHFEQIRAIAYQILKLNPAIDSLKQKIYTDKSIHLLLTQEKLFLSLMNKITFQYDNEAKQKVIISQNMIRFFVFISLLLLALEAWFIYYPTTLKVQSYFTQNQVVTQEIHQYNQEIQSYSKELQQNKDYLNSINEKLSLSEAKFRQLVEKSNVGIFIHNLSHFLYTNPTCAKMFAYSDITLARMSLKDVVHTEFHSLISEEKLRQNAENFIPFRYDLQIITGRGEMFWVDLTLTPIEYQGENLAFIATFIDITEKRQANKRLQDAYLIIEENQDQMRSILKEISQQKIEMEQQANNLKQANQQIALANNNLEEQRAQIAEALVQVKITENKFRALFERSDDSFMIFENWSVVDCNDATLRLFKLKYKEQILEGMESISPLYQLDGEKSTTKAREILRFASRKGYHRTEWLSQKSTGELFYTDISISAINVLGKEIFYMILRDITAQKTIESKLKQSEATLAEAQEIAGLGNWEINLKTKETKWSLQMYQQYGLDPQLPPPSPDENYFNYIYLEDRPLVNQTIQKTKNQSVVELEQRIIRPSGEIRYLYQLAKPLYDIDGNWTGVYGTSLDISDMKRVENELKAKNKDILDSINYAQRIQEAILPSKTTIEKWFPEHFIFFKPKDIVSGDFYWVGYRNYRAIIASVDCTGHGIPGAFMSMIANDLLNDIVNKEGINSPNQILDELRTGIRRVLKQAENQNQDGMDISICSVDIFPDEYKGFLKNPKLEYSGASQPLHYVQNGQLKAIKADKISIGGVNFFEKEKPFTKHIVEITSPTVFYMFSDGYRDQFAEDNRTRFMGQRFKDLLLSMHDKPMEEQKQILDETLNNWKGKSEQIDDILVIGVKIG